MAYNDKTELNKEKGLLKSVWQPIGKEVNGSGN